MLEEYAYKYSLGNHGGMPKRFLQFDNFPLGDSFLPIFS